MKDGKNSTSLDNILNYTREVVSDIEDWKKTSSITNNTIEEDISSDFFRFRMLEYVMIPPPIIKNEVNSAEIKFQTWSVASVEEMIKNKLIKEGAVYYLVKRAGETRLSTRKFIEIKDNRIIGLTAEGYITYSDSMRNINIIKNGFIINGVTYIFIVTDREIENFLNRLERYNNNDNIFISDKHYSGAINDKYLTWHKKNRNVVESIDAKWKSENSCIKGIGSFNREAYKKLKKGQKSETSLVELLKFEVLLLLMGKKVSNRIYFRKDGTGDRLVVHLLEAYGIVVDRSTIYLLNEETSGVLRFSIEEHITKKGDRYAYTVLKLDRGVWAMKKNKKVIESIVRELGEKMKEVHNIKRVIKKSSK